MQPRLPAFVIIGAVKAATTWIAYQLQQNPGVFLPGPEPHFFSTEFGRGLDWYEAFFSQSADGQLIGEKSADYLAHPEAPRRMARLLPKARLVVQFRNPIERAYSDYCMLYRRGAVGRDPARYLRGKAAESQRFLQDGLYHRHLARFLDFFPREQIRVVLHDDIHEQPDAVVRGVCDHIGVASRVAVDRLAQRVNAGEAALLPLPLRQLLGPVKNIVRPLRQKPWFAAVRDRLARPVDYPPLTPDLRMRLRDFYADDVTGLGHMIGRDLKSWLAMDGQEGR